MSPHVLISLFLAGVKVGVKVAIQLWLDAKDGGLFLFLISPLAKLIFNNRATYVFCAQSIDKRHLYNRYTEIVLSTLRGQSH